MFYGLNICVKSILCVLPYIYYRYYLIFENFATREQNLALRSKVYLITKRSWFHGNAENMFSWHKGLLVGLPKLGNTFPNGAYWESSAFRTFERKVKFLEIKITIQFQVTHSFPLLLRNFSKFHGEWKWIVSFAPKVYWNWHDMGKVQ